MNKVLSKTEKYISELVFPLLNHDYNRDQCQVFPNIAPKSVPLVPEQENLVFTVVADLRMFCPGT